MRLVAALAVLLLAVLDARAQQPADQRQADQRPARYVAELADGQRIESDRLTTWHSSSAVPHLGGTSLFDPANPLRWLENRHRRLPEPPDAYVEFASGDRLPGVVVDSRGGAEDRYRPLPPHLIVRTTLAFEPPDNRAVPEIRVLTQPIRRVVWQRQPGLAYQPGTVHFRDGRSLPFRAVRFGSGEMQVLLAEGPRRLDWNDVAELHLPALEVWEAWFDQLAALCPDARTRLIQIETASGLAATASLARFTARFEGNSADPDRWVHGLAPAWSLDILWIPFRDIAVYRSFAAHEVPLSPLLAREASQQGGIATARLPQANRSVHGSALASSGQVFGFGIGMAGGGRLAFDLPPAAVAVRTAFCLDRAAGNGGCVRPRISVGESVQPLWQGPVLMGSQRVVDSGRLALPAAGSSPSPALPRSLVMEVDPLMAGYPPGADPLDIRDFANWCEPLLELDPAAVERELASRLPERFIAWRQWAFGPQKQSASANVRLAFQADGAIPGSFEPALFVSGGPMILRREVEMTEQNRWLVIAASRLTALGAEPQLEVRVGGAVAGTFALPVERAYSPEMRPLVVDLSAYRRLNAARLPVEIRQLPAERAPPAQYWSVEITPQLPTLYQLPLEPARALALGSDLGRQTLHLAAGGRYRIELPEPLRVRAAPRWGEARFLRLAVKKQGGGRVAIELEDEQPRERPPRYDLGQGEPSYGGANRVFHQQLPDDWVAVTRDLFVDFGNIDLKAIVIGCPDGQSVEIGQLDLATTQADFALSSSASAAKPAAAAKREQPPAVSARFVGRAQLATVQLDFGGRRKASGALIDGRGTILTVGHAAIGGGSECRVTFANGTTVRGRKLGVSRGLNLAMVVVSPPAGAVALSVAPGRELRQNESFVALVHLPPRQPARKADARGVQLRRQAGTLLWTDLEVSDALFGAPLLDDSGALVGLFTSTSSFGGLVATRLTADEPAMERMRRGESFGSWLAGGEPLLGFPVAAEGEAVQIKAVPGGSSPAKAGLLAGDILEQIEGRSVRTADDIRQLLADHDPGQQFSVQANRRNQRIEAQITLQPRIP
jgi:S1-C subfamily serine protease